LFPELFPEANIFAFYFLWFFTGRGVFVAIMEISKILFASGNNSKISDTLFDGLCIVFNTFCGDIGTYCNI